MAENATPRLCLFRDLFVMSAFQPATPAREAVLPFREHQLTEPLIEQINKWLQAGGAFTTSANMAVASVRLPDGSKFYATATFCLTGGGRPVIPTA